MALGQCKTCERIAPVGLLGASSECRRCVSRRNILKAQATRTRYARLGFKKYDARCNKTGKHAKKAASASV